MIGNTTIKNRLAKLERAFQTHQGSPGKESHQSVNKITSGFALPRHVSRVFLPSGTDVTFLEDGYYYGSALVNAPENIGTAIVLLDVKSSGEGRKDFVLKLSADGQQWERTIHTGGEGGSGWYQTQGYSYYKNAVNEKMNGTGVIGNYLLKGVPLGRAGQLVTLDLQISNVTAITPNTNKLILPFETNKLAPKFNFKVSDHDWNIQLPDQSRIADFGVTSNGITLAVTDNCTTATTFRVSLSWTN